jgi:prevent-host-death family protein
MKTKYSIYEAKTHLSEILRQVRQNKPVIITDRGKEVARVVPMEQPSNFEKRLEALEKAGIITSSPNADPSKIRLIARRPGALKRFLEDRHRY